MNTMMSIGEFARRTRLAPSAIRFYGERGLLIAADTDTSTGYRSFSSDQVGQAILIRDLRRMDMSLADIGRAIGLPEPERRLLIDAHLERLEDALHRAHAIAEALGVPPRSLDNEQETTMSTKAKNPKSARPTTTPSEPVDSEPIATLRARDVADALDQVLPTAGTNPHLPHLMCVLLESKDDSVRLVATDSHRLTIRDLMPLSSTNDFSHVLAAATISVWSDVLRATDDDHGIVTLGKSGKDVRLTGPDIDLSARPIPSTFPDYEAVLVPTQELAHVIVDRDEILRAFETFDEPGERAGAVLMSTTPDGITLQRNATQVEIGGSTSIADAHVAVDPRYAATAVRHARSTDIVIDVDHPDRPVVIRSVDDGTYTSRIMPVKLA